MMSTIYIRQDFYLNRARMISIVCWNVAGGVRELCERCCDAGEVRDEATVTLQSLRKGRSSVWVVETLNPWMASVFLFAIRADLA